MLRGNCTPINGATNQFLRRTEYRIAKIRRDTARAIRPTPSRRKELGSGTPAATASTETLSSAGPQPVGGLSAVSNSSVVVEPDAVKVQVSRTHPMLNAL